MNINRSILCYNPNNTGQRKDAKGNPVKGTLADYFNLSFHYTGALDLSRPRYEQTAKNNAIYYRDNDNAHASANYVVDEKEVYEMVPWDSDRIAWHIGIGANNTKDYYMKNSKGIEINNGNTIGVEICTCKLNPNSKKDDDPDWYFDPDTYRNAIELGKNLIQKFNIPRENVFRHYDCNSKRKLCPSQFVGSTVKTYYGKTGDELWQQFLNDLYDTTAKNVLQAYVVSSSDGTLNLRERPQNEGKLIKVMRSGDFVLATQELSTGWVFVKYVADNKVYTGYCFKKYLKKATSIEGRCVQSPDGTLNIRANPSSTSSLINTMNNDYIFTVLKICNPSWGFIWCGETIGYCNITNNYSYKL